MSQPRLAFAKLAPPLKLQRHADGGAREGLNPFLAPLKLREGDAGLWDTSRNFPPVAPVVIQIQAFQA